MTGDRFLLSSRSFSFTPAPHRALLPSRPSSGPAPASRARANDNGGALSRALSEALLLGATPALPRRPQAARAAADLDGTRHASPLSGHRGSRPSHRTRWF